MPDSAPSRPVTVDLPLARRKGLAYAIIGILVLSPDTLIIRLIDADQATLLWWRGVLMFLGLAVFLVAKHRGETWAAVRGVPPLGWLSSLAFAASTILFITSVTLTTVANTLVIIASAPLFAALLSRFLLRERVPMATWLCIGVGIGAIVLIFVGNHGLSSGAQATTSAFWGDLCAVGSAILLAGHFVNARRAHAVSLMPPLAVSGLLVMLVMTPFASPFDIGTGDFSKLILLGLIIMPIAFGLLSEAPRYLPAAEVSLIILLETALGPLWVWLVLAEVPDTWTVVGGAILVATLVVHAAHGLRGNRDA